MIEVGNVLVHEDIIKNDFVCNLNKCKGICCVEGDAGAPLSENETHILREIYPKVKPYMTEKGIQAIEEQLHKLYRRKMAWSDLHILRSGRQRQQGV